MIHDRRPLLGSNTSRSPSPVPSASNYHSINLSNEPRQSFYSPVPSPESTNNNKSLEFISLKFRQ